MLNVAVPEFAECAKEVRLLLIKMVKRESAVIVMDLASAREDPEKALAQMVIISTHVLTVAVKAPKCMTVSGANMLSHTMAIAPYAKVQDMRVTE